MKVKFSDKESYLYTPFYATESGTWKNQAACKTLVEKMLLREDGDTTSVKILDPRYYYYFTTTRGVPTQLSPVDLQDFLAKNNEGYYASGGEFGNLKTGEWYPMLNYSEILFIFAEAASRGWMGLNSQETKELYLKACEASILEWNPNDKVDSAVGTTRSEYIVHLDQTYDAAESLKIILTQKWISTFWLGVESWADYRRTGYPILKTNGKNAKNRKILCTRLRYPATEDYYNKKNYQSAVNGWLGGEDNMLTDVWWADTQESMNIRKEGRKE